MELSIQGRITVLSDFGFKIRVIAILAFSLAGFVALAQPTITSFSPTKGPAGTSVVLTGTGFSTTPASNIVYFGTTKGTVTAATATSLSVTVPAEAKYERISVATGGLVAYSRTAFLPTYNNAFGSSFATTSFSAQSSFAANNNLSVIVHGDIDNDGKADMVASDGALSILFNNHDNAGSISYLARQDQAIGTPAGIALADMDGDGQLDIIFSNPASDVISILRNTSTGGVFSYSSKTDFATLTDPASIAVGDLDGDGKIDVAVANSTSAKVSVFRNLSSGPGSINLATKADITPASTPAVLAIADLDVDGRADLVCGAATLSTFKNSSTLGSISFAAKADLTPTVASRDLALADMDGDGRPEIVSVGSGASNTISLFRNTSSGSVSFAPKADVTTGSTPRSLAVGDIDGDGKPDLVAGGFDVSIIRNQSTVGTLSFATRVDYTSQSVLMVTLHDINGDGRIDMVRGITAGTSFLPYRNDITSQNSIPVITSFSPASGPVGSSVTLQGANFDATAANNVVYFGATRATVTLASATSLTVTVPTGTTFQPVSVSVNNLSASSKASFIATNPGGTGLDANSYNPTDVGFAANAYLSHVALADFDQDGKPDIAVADYNSPSTVYRNTSASKGAISFATGVDDGNTIADPRSITTGDFNSDGRLDMIVLDYSTHFFNNYANTSTGPGTISFGRNAYTTGVQPTCIAKGDLDGDGKPDVVVGYETGTAISVWGNTSAGAGLLFFGTSTNFTVGTGPQGVAVGDLNGDGKPEIVAANSGTGAVPGTSISILKNNSSGTGNISFAAKQDITSLGSGPAAVSLGDVDGDGLNDVVVRYNNDFIFSVLRNTSPGDGSITFAARVDYTSAPANSVTLSDLDGDGKVDMVESNNGNPYLVKLYGNTVGSPGAISFAAPVAVTTSAVSNYATGGDLDADGKTDLIAIANSNVNIFRRQVTPAATTAAAGSSIGEFAFTANWAASAQATNYYLDVSTSNSFGSFVSGYNNLSVGNVTSYVVNASLAGGVQYFYRVRAADGSLAAASSNTISITTFPPDPILTAATAVTQTSFNANWGAAATATNYIMDVATNPGFGSPIAGSPFSVGNVLTKNVSGLTAGTVYYYRVRAVNSTGGTSGNSSPQNIVTVPPNPVSSAATTITITTFSANWLATTSATGYSLDVSTDAGFGATIAGSPFTLGNVLTKSVTGLTAGTAYYYRVRATNSSGTSGNSGDQTLFTIAPAPVSSAATAITQTSFSANWAAALSATGYSLDVTTDVGFAAPITGSPFSLANVLTKGITGLTAGTTYYYRVRAINSGGTSSNSSPQTVLTSPPDPVSSAGTGMTQTAFSANWGASTSATGYLLDVSTSNTFGTFVSGYSGLAVGNVTTFNVNTNLTTGTQYFYRIRAVNGSGTSLNSNTSSATTIPGNPVLILPSVTPNSITINWNAVTGATGFLLDVSTDNFATFVGIYNNQSVAGPTSFVATGLTPATVYQIRLRSQNTSGPSSNSNVIGATTLDSEPFAQPTSLGFSGVTSNSMSGSFSIATGSPTGYLVLYKAGSAVFETPADGTGYSAGNAIGASTVASVGPNTFALSGLSPGTTYFFAVFSYNGTTNTFNYLTASPLQNAQVTSTTEPGSQPTNLAFVNTTTTTTDISFTAAAGPPTGYIVLRKAGAAPTEVPSDGTAYATGSSIGTSTVAYVGSNISFTDNGLLSGTSYFYEVFSYNGTTGTYNYLITSPLSGNTIMKPPAPVALDATNVISGSFKAKWNVTTGAATYQLDVATAEDFSAFVPGYNAKSTSLTEETLSGLTVAQTNYWYRVRAVNASGFSINSNVIDLTTPATGGTVPLTINAPVATGLKITVTVANGTGARTIKFYSKGITAASFTNATLTSASDSYEVTVLSTSLDELGLEYYFTAIDASIDEAVETTHGYLYKSIGAASTSNIPFGSQMDGTAGTYVMFSLPYNPTDKTVAGIFDELGGSDKTKWRLFHYQGGKYVEYPDNITTIEPGRSYWFNANVPAGINPGEGNVVTANQDNPFSVTLEKGWNQVGNPYSFNLDWSAMKDANPSVGLNSLWLFESANYVKKDVLAAWKGGFVFSDNGGTTVFPISAKTNAGGRVQADVLSLAIDEAAWQLPVTLTLSGFQQTSAVGMHPDASLSKDRFDEITIPRFNNYLEMDTYHEEFFAPHFATDVIPTANTGSWQFTTASNQQGESATLTWNMQAISNSRSNILLLDLQTQNIVDMKRIGSYSFKWSGGSQFRILYSREGDIQPGVTLLGNAYPNPFAGTVTIPFVLETDQAMVDISVYDMLGRKVRTLRQRDVKAGIRQFEWEGKDDVGGPVDSGLYLYQLSGEKGVLARPKRLVRQ